ncbi:MAG: HPr family phosphocarrier protein [Sandarakinorhabdus sp.]|nr:HPr family phosphocarrier protein [Sandarakinorhabdus sp.]
MSHAQGSTAGPIRVPITNRRGLHARASAKFVTLASSFDAEVTVGHDGSAVTGTSIMGLMMLAAAMGDEIVISATGPDAEAAVSKLVGLVMDKFGED